MSAPVGEFGYRQIIEAVPEGIWIVSPEGRTVFSNRRMAEVLGVEFDSMVQQSCFACVFPEDAADAQRLFARALRGDRRPFDFRLRRADGSPTWVSISCMTMKNATGEAVALLGLFTEINERKKAEEELRHSEAQFRSLVDSAPIMTWMSGPSTTATFFNATALAYAGMTPEEATGRGYLQAAHPEDIDEYLKIIHAATQKRSAFSVEVRFRRVDGVYRWFLITGVPRFEAGEYQGHVGTGIDITDLKRSHEQHLGAQQLESLGVLAAGVAHDFNNLLSAIMSLAESAQLGVAPASEPAQDLEQIVETATHAAEIVSQLMTFARQETGPASPVDLSRLVAEMLQLLRVSISKLAVLETDLPQDLPPVLANPAEIRQVVMNLMINASESLVGKPGTIWVRTARTERGVRLEVRDTGCGMADEVKAQIFEPFFTTRFVGRGLGLSVIHGVVRRHGGTVEVESTLGEGSRFTVTLPCAEVPASGA